MLISPYLTFNGQCEAAFKFYEKCLGAKIQSMFPFEGSPMADQVGPAWGKMIMHARLAVGDELLMGSDALPERYEQPKGFSVSLGVSEPEDAERIFHALAEGGAVSMPIQQTFWSLRFGMLTDRFGIPWMISCNQAS